MFLFVTSVVLSHVVNGFVVKLKVVSSETAKDVAYPLYVKMKTNSPKYTYS